MAGVREECGVFGIYDNDGLDVVMSSYYALYALQHRGQECCGIAVNDDGVITGYRDAGLVNEVFTEELLPMIKRGNMAIGHVRYGTKTFGSIYGRKSDQKRLNAQPLVVNHVKGTMALAHNGSLTNAVELREELENNGSIFYLTSDIEVISYIITKERLTSPSIEQAVNRAMNKLKGAYSLIVMSATKMIAARDPNGFHPLCIGKINNSYVFASESCALDSIGAKFIRDVEPGEIVICDKNGLHSIKDHCVGQKTSACVFEYIYIARPDSVLDGTSVHAARINAGAYLAKEHPVKADVVIGVPDSGIDAALGYSRESGIPYGIGFIKNKYIGRSFIQPSQKERESAVRIKLNPVSETVKDKRVVLIDDSIVRGTTLARIVGLLRDAGAKEVHIRISSPPFKYPCYFGTDVESQDELIACKYSVEEIAKKLNADSLGYLSEEDVLKIADKTKLGFCTACFNGEYPIAKPAKEKKYLFMQRISEKETNN